MILCRISTFQFNIIVFFNIIEMAFWAFGKMKNITEKLNIKDVGNKLINYVVKFDNYLGAGQPGKGIESQFWRHACNLKERKAERKIKIDRRIINGNSTERVQKVI